MSAPLSISLVTPSLNQARFLKDTIESVLSQGHTALEYSVRDGGSTDGSLAILESYRDRVPFLSQRDAGQADAINSGLRDARGEILGYLNSDDVLLPGALAAVSGVFANDPGLVLVYGKAVYVDAGGRRLGPYLTAPFSRLPEMCGVAQPAAFWRRTVRDEVGEFDASLRHAFDYDYWLRIATRFEPSRVLYLDRELAAARVHDEAKTVSGWERAFEETFRVVKKHAGAVSLWWCLAKWDRKIDGRDPVLHPHSVSRRAYLPALLEFLRRNPTRPDVWVREFARALWAPARASRTSSSAA